MKQYPIPDLDQMSLFGESLSAAAPVRSLEEVLLSGNVSALGEFLKQISHKELRIELLHCGFLLEESRSKQMLIDQVWSKLLHHTKQRCLPDLFKS